MVCVGSGHDCDRRRAVVACGGRKDCDSCGRVDTDDGCGNGMYGTDHWLWLLSESTCGAKDQLVETYRSLRHK